MMDDRINEGNSFLSLEKESLQAIWSFHVAELFSAMSLTFPSRCESKRWKMRDHSLKHDTPHSQKMSIF
jgi:hypothetical protein